MSFFKINSADLQRGLKNLSKVAEKGGDVHKALVEATRRVTINVGHEIGYRAQIGGRYLKGRSGFLRRSWQPRRSQKASQDNDVRLFKVDEKGKSIVGMIGSNLPYAAIHEFGGTIRPKRSKWLAIPVGPAKTKAGVARRGGMGHTRGGPRSFPGLVVIRSKNKFNTLLLAEVHRFKKTGGRSGASTSVRRRKIRVFFVLKKSVRIPARRYISRGAKAGLAKAPRIMNRVVQEHLNKLDKKVSRK